MAKNKYNTVLKPSPMPISISHLAPGKIITLHIPAEGTGTRDEPIKRCRYRIVWMGRYFALLETAIGIRECFMYMDLVEYMRG